MKFSIFNVFRKMADADEQNKTSTLGRCESLVGARKVRGGCVIEMEADESSLYKVMSGDLIPVLILVDAKEYRKAEMEEKTLCNQFEA